MACRRHRALADCSQHLHVPRAQATTAQKRDVVAKYLEHLQPSGTASRHEEYITAVLSYCEENQDADPEAERVNLLCKRTPKRRAQTGRFRVSNITVDEIVREVFD